MKLTHDVVANDTITVLQILTLLFIYIMSLSAAVREHMEYSCLFFLIFLAL